MAMPNLYFERSFGVMFFKQLSQSNIYNFPDYSDYRGQEVLEYFEERTKNIIVNDELKDWTLTLFLSF